MLKNRIFAILIVLTLMTPVFAENPVSMEQNTAEAQQEAAIPDTQQPEHPPELNLPANELNPNSYKQPVSKRNIAKKFLLAMCGVAISSIILFVLLSLYNRVRGVLAAPAETQEGETSLLTPDSITDAVKAFLDKTRY